MGRLLYVDAFSGVAGDMMLGALIHAGAPLEELVRWLKHLRIEGWSIETQTKLRGGIHGVDLRVRLESELREPVAGHGEEPGPDEAHRHEPAHGHESGDRSAPDHHEPESVREQDPGHSHSRGHGRRWPEIESIIREAGLPERAESRALAIFRRLAEAEGRVHDVPPEEVHFHEVGAVDAIIDIVGTAIALELLDIEEVYSSPLAIGEGFVRCAHGLMPVPVPATLELTRGFAVRPTGLREELVTPTGAAIVTTLARRGAVPPYRLVAVGYGLGDRERESPPNLLRVIVGEPITSSGADGTIRDTVVVLEANLDDCTGEIIGYAQERLLEAGALDVYGLPLQMKKGRPGFLVGVIARPEDADEMERILLVETTTLGVRRSLWMRGVLARESRSVETPYGRVSVKWAETPAGERCSPEYEDCRRLARETGQPLWKVFAAARDAAGDRRASD